jgi:hypothetical protein
VLKEGQSQGPALSGPLIFHHQSSDNAQRYSQALVQKRLGQELLIHGE